MDFTEIKKKYSWVLFSYFIFGVVMEASSFILSFLLKDASDSWSDNSWIVYSLGLMPIWALGFPVCLLLAHRTPSEKPEEHVIKPKYMIQFYFILVFFMMAFNIVGTIITSGIQGITGITIDNTTIDLINKQDFLPTAIFAGILGPMFEELAFRKLLIDKLGHYNKRYTIYLSGIMFGLFHTNMHQFFYATIIGVIFAYIYTISGRIRYTIGLHMTFNFIHGIIPMTIMKFIDLEFIQNLDSLDSMDPEVQQQLLKLYSNPAFALLILYLFIIFAFIIVGFVLWLINFKRLKVNDKESPLPIGEGKKVVFLNLGFILFAVLMIGITVYEIVLMNI